MRTSIALILIIALLQKQLFSQQYCADGTWSNDGEDGGVPANCKACGVGMKGKGVKFPNAAAACMVCLGQTTAVVASTVMCDCPNGYYGKYTDKASTTGCTACPAEFKGTLIPKATQADGCEACAGAAAGSPSTTECKSTGTLPIPSNTKCNSSAIYIFTISILGLIALIL